MPIDPTDDERAAAHIAELENILNEATEATGVAGVDAPMTLLECIVSLRERGNALERILHVTGECCRGADPRCAAGCLQEREVRDKWF